MIQVEHLTKKFGGYTALHDISVNIQDNCIYGLVGSNGAGKSTLIRILAGVYKADAGDVLMDGEPVWENPAAKARIAYVSDEIYYFPGATPARMADMYAAVYPHFNRDKYRQLAEKLHLDTAAGLHTFSKGMRRQAITVLALATEPSYIFFDETFDGLDPVMRGYIKRLIVEDMNARGATAIITSHSLRELEDSCDQLALLHKGGLVLESEIGRLKTSRFKIQIAFSKDYDRNKFRDLDVVYFHKTGSVANMIINGNLDEAKEKLYAMQPLLLDIMPLSLEEVFTYEMQALGYEFDLYEETGAGAKQSAHTEEGGQA